MYINWEIYTVCTLLKLYTDGNTHTRTHVVTLPPSPHLFFQGEQRTAGGGNRKKMINKTVKNTQTPRKRENEENESFFLCFTSFFLLFPSDKTRVPLTHTLTTTFLNRICTVHVITGGEGHKKQNKQSAKVKAREMEN